jgi:hypothetical protein
MGHHFFPRRGVELPQEVKLPFSSETIDISSLVPRKIKLPKNISDSSFNVLKPGGMSRGDFYELHFKVDPKFKTANFPQDIGGIWDGREIVGLKKYDRLGRLWYGSPTKLKVAAGAAAGGAAGIGGGAYWLANQRGDAGVAHDDASSPVTTSVSSLPGWLSAPQDGVKASTNAPVSSATGSDSLPNPTVWPPWDSDDQD